MKQYLFFLVLATFWADTLYATIIVDQENDVRMHPGVLSYYLDYPGDYLQQTFTVGRSGKLAGVGVQVSLYKSNYDRIYDPPSDDLHMKIVRTDPNGFGLLDDVLAEGTISPTSLVISKDLQGDAITDVDLSSFQAQVTAGEKLSIILSSNQTDHSGSERALQYLWFRNLSNPYPGGEHSVYSPEYYGPTPLLFVWNGAVEPTMDAGFRVHVDVIPEPSSWLLLACCFALISRIARRNQAFRIKHPLDAASGSSVASDEAMFGLTSCFFS